MLYPVRIGSECVYGELQNYAICNHVRCTYSDLLLRMSEREDTAMLPQFIGWNYEYVWCCLMRYSSPMVFPVRVRDTGGASGLTLASANVRAIRYLVPSPELNCPLRLQNTVSRLSTMAVNLKAETWSLVGFSLGVTKRSMLGKRTAGS